MALIESVLKKRASGETLSCGSAAVDVSLFRFTGTDIRLTTREIDLLAALAAQEEPSGKDARTIISSLNEKLKRLDQNTRISYEPGKGYRLVTEHE